MSNKDNKNTAQKGFFATLARWGKRMFFGASKELTEDEIFAVEKLESPSMMAVKAFFRRALAVIALIVLIAMFLFVFIGPKFFPMDLTYTDPLQANMAPNYTLLKVPAEMKDNIKSISSFADFTVGKAVAGLAATDISNVSGCTIYAGGYLAVIVRAAGYAR